MKNTQSLLSTIILFSVIGILAFGMSYRCSGLNFYHNEPFAQTIETGLIGGAIACGILASTSITLYVLVEMMLYKESKKLSD